MCPNPKIGIPISVRPSKRNHPNKVHNQCCHMCTYKLFNGAYFSALHPATNNLPSTAGQRGPPVNARKSCHMNDKLLYVFPGSQFSASIHMGRVVSMPYNRERAIASCLPASPVSQSAWLYTTKASTVRTSQQPPPPQWNHSAMKYEIVFHIYEEKEKNTLYASISVWIIPCWVHGLPI
jgi:hypothetical protein